MPLVKPTPGVDLNWGPIVNDALDYLDAEVAAETAARIADVNAEETARIAAVTAEATTRANADTAEATARANADTAEVARADAAYVPKSSLIYARAVKAAAQSIPNNTQTVIAFDGETFDPSNIRAPGDDKLVLNKIGKWLVTGQVSFASNATGIRRAALLHNGVVKANPQVNNAGATSYVGVSFTDIVDVTAITDYVQLACLQDSGGALNTSTTGANFLAATYLGP